MFKFHPSSVGLLMPDAKSIDPALLTTPELKALAKKKVKTDEDKAILAPLWERTLSVGAQSYLKNIAKEFLFGYRRDVSTKELKKGLAVEDDAIALCNRVFFENYIKNTERRSNDWLTGECDIYREGEYTLDVKSSWSLDTFPLTSEDCHSEVYYWQGIGYGVLWPDAKYHEVRHCLLPTPEELCRYEDPRAHDVAHINPAHRVTRIRYQRDDDAARRLHVKCIEGQIYLERFVAKFMLDHSIETE